MKGLIVGLSFLAMSSVAFAGAPTSQASRVNVLDQESSAGGWMQDCNSGNVFCTSGRTIGCNSQLNGSIGGSECTQHTGDVGWVYCYTYDQTGAVTSSFYDSCP